MADDGGKLGRRALCPICRTSLTPLPSVTASSAMCLLISLLGRWGVFRMEVMAKTVHDRGLADATGRPLAHRVVSSRGSTAQHAQSG